MKRTFSTYLTLFWVILIAGCDPLSYVTVKEICFDHLKQCIYFKRKERGLNYGIVVISTSSNKLFSANREKEYVISAGTDDIFYKKEENKLFLYVLQPAKIPPEFKSQVVIEQIDISGPEKVKLRANYKEKGLEKF